jgi:ubiquinone/menaquinone biosynthesis C-methylase UbiE
MKKTNDAIYNSFFKTYSKNVDKAQDIYFWKLLDEVIFSLITKYIPASLSKEGVIVDAGGGTGRWIELLSKVYKSKFILYDKSADMLESAKAKSTLKSLGDRLQIMHGDIQRMKQIEDKSVDYLISIYNPISFVEKPVLFFREIRRILKKDGKALVMGQAFYNAIASKINNYVAPEPELKKLGETSKVRWAQYVPELHVFTKESFEKLAKEAQLNVVTMHGVSVFIQPAMEDFDSSNKKLSRLSQQLKKDKKLYKQIFNMEMKYNEIDSMINRGMNIMVVLQKK